MLAGLVLATTPVAALMFRFNNPDALLVLLLVAAGYAVTRALEDTKTRWLVLAGVLVGLGFITKMMQAFLVVPGFGLVYLIYAQTSLKRRIYQLLASLGGIVAGCGWWLAAVSLTPAADRPYIGGSTDNSIWNLIFGYNGFGRLSGNETGSVGGAPAGIGGGSMWGPTGLHRLFNTDFGGQISWLLPTALVLTVAALVALRRAGRTDGKRAQVGLWASWLIVTGLVISLSKGIIHPYYTVALAPAIGALVGIGSVLLWRAREELWSRVAMAATILLTAWWSHRLLDRSPTWHPWIRDLVLAAGVASAVAVLLPPAVWQRLGSRAVHLAAATAIVVGLAGPIGYSLNTSSTAYAGAIPSAGPSVQGGGFGPGRGGPGGQGLRPGAGGFPGFGGQPGGGFVPPGAGGFGGTRTAPFGGTGTAPFGGNGTSPFGNGSGQRGIGGQFRGVGGLLNSGAVSSALTAALKANASDYTWVAAAIGAENASGYQLAADEPVMAIGGFNGTDQDPSLATFENYVSEGKIHYFIGGGGLGGGFGGPGGQSGASSDASQISAWVEAHFTATTIGGTTVYDLTSPSTTSSSTSESGTSA
jgi:4-amino-4-deoxy-L-arabinose transferase-like glycosyltransferase